MLGENKEKFKNENKYHNNLKEYRKQISSVFFQTVTRYLMFSAPCPLFNELNSGCFQEQ